MLNIDFTNDTDPDVMLLYDSKDINKYLADLIRAGKPTAWDIETNSLLPYYSDAYIYSWSFYNGKGLATAFLHSPAIEGMLKRFLLSDIEKICHNVAFEYKWCEEKLDVKMDGKLYDTMIAAHILNNQQQCGLKYLAKRYLNVDDYDAIIKPFLKSRKGEYKNTVEDAPLTSLLKYNAFDSLYTYQLYEIFEPKTDKLYPFKFFMDGLRALIQVSSNGFKIDTDYCKDMYEELGIESTKLIQQLKEDETGKLWESVYGLHSNYNSSTQLRHIIYDELKFPVDKLTKKGLPSVDKEVLKEIDTPFFNILNSYKQTESVRTLLINGLRGNVDDNKLLHGNYNLHVARSYRLSSSNPNLQNMPIHDEKYGKIIREAFLPHKDQQIMEVDYCGLEARISCVLHQDKNMIDYTISDGSDIHKDMAMQIYMLQEDKIIKEIRGSVKGDWTFAQMYGSYYVQCAKALWKSVKKLKLLTHLRKNGIYSYQQFEEHIKNIEYDFWNNRFPQYTQWKEEQYKIFKEQKYLQSPLGFIYVGDMSKNQLTNYPCQGLASHILLWCLIKINNYLNRGNFKTKIINTVHDSIVFSMEPSEVGRLIPVIRRIMTKDVIKRFGFINIPLAVDFELAPINSSWYKKIKYQ